VTDLLKHEKIVTTEAKAKESARHDREDDYALVKKSGLTSYRQALAFITDEKVAQKVFSEAGAAL